MLLYTTDEKIESFNVSAIIGNELRNYHLQLSIMATEDHLKVIEMMPQNATRYSRKMFRCDMAG